MNEGAAAKILTSGSKKKLKNVAIFIKDEDEEEESEEEVKEEPKIMGRGKRTAILESKLRQDASAEEKRKQHQKVRK